MTTDTKIAAAAIATAIAALAVAIVATAVALGALREAHKKDPRIEPLQARVAVLCRRSVVTGGRLTGRGITLDTTRGC